MEKTVRHMDEVVFMKGGQTRIVANVARVHSDTMIDVIYQDEGGVHEAASVPHRSVNDSGNYFIHPSEEEK